MFEREDIVVAGLTHQGMVRKDNQDSYGFIEPESDEVLKRYGRLFIVADGLGGHRGGKVASRMAVDIIGKLFYAAGKEPVYPALLHAINLANQNIYEASSKHEELQGMATTCTAMVIQPPHIHLAHVGDSRAYLIRSGQIRQLSTDHTLVEEMVNSGIINHDEARSHPDSHILTRSLGILQTVEIDTLDPPVLLQPGDTILMCSDGLTVYLEDAEIRDIVMKHPPDRACEILVETANERGGRDNVTVEIVHAKPAPGMQPDFLEETEPLLHHTEKFLGSMPVVLPEESGKKESSVKMELLWAALFYLIYITCMCLYFLFFFRH